MLSIQKIFGHDQKFFDLLEASAQQADTININHGCRRSEAFQRYEVDRGGANYLGLDFYPARDRPTGICAGARRDCVVINA